MNKFELSFFTIMSVLAGQMLPCGIIKCTDIFLGIGTARMPAISSAEKVTKSTLYFTKVFFFFIPEV